MNELVNIKKSCISSEINDLPAELDDLREKMGDVIAAATSTETRRAYSCRLNSFDEFCKGFGVSSLPATPGTVAAFVTECVKDRKSAAYIGQAMAAIRAAHRRKGLANPTESELVKVAVRGARRELGTAPHKKAAATVEVLRSLVESLSRNTLQGKRDAAILLLGFAGAFRRSELVSLDVEDLEKTTAKDGKDAYLVHIRHSKTDQEGHGLIKAVFPTASRDMNPVVALDEYMAAAGISSGAIFRRIRRGGHVEEERITDRSVALIVKAAADRADVSLDLAGHSLRSGFITSALASGQSERSVMNQTGHKSVTVMRSYQQRANALLDNAAAGLAGLM